MPWKDKAKARANDRERDQRPERKAARKIARQKWLAAHPGYGKKVWSEKTPAQRWATGQVKIALRAGRLTRQPCEICGDERTEAHHDDYSRPLDVRWLCRPHHMEQHRIYP